MSLKEQYESIADGRQINRNIEISDLAGKTIEQFEITKNKRELYIKAHDQDAEYIYRFCHDQECCENVWLEEIFGDLESLPGSVIYHAHIINNHGVKRTNECSEAEEWTFYIINTNRTTVTMRWYGESNGYYSTDVQVDKLTC